MASSSSFEVNQELAKYLFSEGSTLVMLNVPKGTDIGIDIKSWNIGENFRGIKMIPPGFHYIHYSAVDKFEEKSSRIGFIRWFKKAEFIVKRWDIREETLSSEPVSDEAIQGLKDNLLDLDRYLGPYPYDIWKQWQELTNRIDSDIVDRCTPSCGYISSVLELENVDDKSRIRGVDESRKRKRGLCLSVEQKEEELLPQLKPKQGTDLKLTKLPNLQYPEGSTPAEITKHLMDSSYTLDLLLSKLKNPIEVIGELQLAFVCFLVGQSLDAFEHWKLLVSLICRADCAISVRRQIYTEFLRTLEVQLIWIPEEVLYDIVASNNFVYHNLRLLFSNIEANTDVDVRLKSEAVRMRDRISSKFTWDFSNLQEEGEEDCPVIVNLDGE
ncbi:protein AAR2 homolog [Leptopilina heterotoma]|uniref:protein AAR2 homolog n=1 Tax=Leptopilina heterotoma TaxID=63436 RepID=UPI001CA9F39F|nr:protein AAR2 homolog [Leptopilina heterotoma]XP_043469889.1 protein AAR2 homolog [Leptopilina heterotoma]